MWETLWCAPTLELPKFVVLVTAQHSFAGWRRGSFCICLTAMTQDFKTLYGILRHFMSQNWLVKGCGCKYCATQCMSKHFQYKYIQYNIFFLSSCCFIFFNYLFHSSTMLVWTTAAPFCSRSVSPEENFLLSKELKVLVKAPWRVLNLLLSSSPSSWESCKLFLSGKVFSCSRFISQLPV